MTDFRPLRERPLADRVRNIVNITGADEGNDATDSGAKPWEPWSSPVMILAGMGNDGRPWLWLACADCGWFLGYASQYEPSALADAARKHRESCPGSAPTPTRAERPWHEVLSEAKATGKCPVHGDELVYDPDKEVQASGWDQEHMICPSDGCKVGAWYG